MLAQKFLKLKNTVLIGLFSATIGFFGASQALTVTSGCTSATFCTLTELFAGGSIQVDNAYFDGFSTASPPSASLNDNILVSGIGGGTNVGLEFRDFGSGWEIAAAGASTRTSYNSLRYNVTVSGGQQLTSSTLNMVNGNGGVFSISGSNAIAPSINIGAMLGNHSFFSVNNFSPFNSVSASGTFLNSFLDVSLVASGLNTFVNLDVFQQRFGLNDVAPVPVPAAVWLLGSAIVLLSGFRSRRSKV